MGLKDEWRARKALIAHSKGNYDEAFSEYEAMFAAGTLVNAKYLLPYSVLLLRKEQYEKAREVLKKAEKSPGGLDPSQRALLLTNYAVACYNTRSSVYAIELLEEVHRKNPNGNSYATLGYLLVEQGDFEKALAFNETAVDYDDEDPLALDNMGQTYYRLGGEEGKKQAKEWFEKAVRFKPDAVDSNYFLALYDVDAGHYEAARKKLEICLQGRISPLNYATRERVQALLDSFPQ